MFYGSHKPASSTSLGRCNPPRCKRCCDDCPAEDDELVINPPTFTCRKSRHD